eukprot:scaffold6339_cov112-Isochrysis_galbana.AAC.7
MEMEKTADATAWFSPSSKRCFCDRARRRFVSSRFIQFMFNLRFDKFKTQSRAFGHKAFS